MATNRRFDTFTEGYLECALWSSTDVVDGEDVELDTFSLDDLSDEVTRDAIKDCALFQKQNADDLEEQGFDDRHNGHDLWLTRNLHGAGYWDSGTGEVGLRLTAAAEKFGEYALYIGDDGKIYGM